MTPDVLPISIETPNRPSATHRKATDMRLEPCLPAVARAHIAQWHSRLPVTQRGPWRFAFVAVLDGTHYGAALWNNPSARMLPNDWLELRRLAIPDDAPPHSASWMLGAMRRWIRANVPACPRLISYQDLAVHTGTIYKAAGWHVAYTSKPRVRDRSKPRVGTQRAYRSNINGVSADGAAKARWEITP